jgi:hypothetical protein
MDQAQLVQHSADSKVEGLELQVCVTGLQRLRINQEQGIPYQYVDWERRERGRVGAERGLTCSSGSYIRGCLCSISDISVSCVADS